MVLADLYWLLHREQRASARDPLTFCKGVKAMQSKYVVALSVAAGFALGVAAIQTLQAQAKPPGYLVAEVAVTVDQDAYMNPFMTETLKSTKDAGAKYLAGGFNNATAVSGAPAANRVVILQFENIDKAKAWYAGGQKEREKELGSKVASSFRIQAVDGVNP
jgi:uncharacterized protein (DUF1330 family)